MLQNVYAPSLNKKKIPMLKPKPRCDGVWRQDTLEVIKSWGGSLSSVILLLRAFTRATEAGLTYIWQPKMSDTPTAMGNEN